MSKQVDKLVGLLRTETWGLHPRLHAVNLAASLLPRRGSGEKRARILTLAGFRIGKGTEINGVPRISGRAGLLDRLDIGEGCSIDVDCVLDLEEHITMGNRVTLGPGVMVLTSTHEMAGADHRAGEGVVVEPGSVVNKDVAPNTRVGGIPATPLEVLAPS